MPSCFGTGYGGQNGVSCCKLLQLLWTDVRQGDVRRQDADAVDRFLSASDVSSGEQNLPNLCTRETGFSALPFSRRRAGS